MDLSEACTLARLLMGEHELSDWIFVTNKNKRRLGVCREKLKRIELSEHYILRNTQEHITDTLLHEIAHALVGVRHGHDDVWKQKCIELGCSPRAFDASADMPTGRWQATCPTCSRLFAQHRRPKRFRIHFCLVCGQEAGRLTFTEVAFLPAKLSKKPPPGKPGQLLLELDD